jgi:hypothetical protein
MPRIMQLKVMVEKVLAEEEDTRNSDLLLTHRIWQRWYGVGDEVTLQKMFELPREDNVKRIRAKFNHEKKYLPTSLKVAKARGFNENEWRNLLGYLPRGEETRPAVATEAEFEKRFR